MVAVQSCRLHWWTINRVGAVAALAVKVDIAGVLVKDDVFQDGAEADGVVDLGLAALLEADALGVAAALDVEDPVVAPAVLVVSNQRARRVRGQRRLPRACSTQGGPLYQCMLGHKQSEYEAT